jgi:hypothetical protein
MRMSLPVEFKGFPNLRYFVPFSMLRKAFTGKQLPSRVKWPSEMAFRSKSALSQRSLYDLRTSVGPQALC